MTLPEDVVRWLSKHFSAADLPAARELLELAVDYERKPGHVRDLNQPIR